MHYFTLQNFTPIKMIMMNCTCLNSKNITFIIPELSINLHLSPENDAKVILAMQIFGSVNVRITLFLSSYMYM